MYGGQKFKSKTTDTDDCPLDMATCSGSACTAADAETSRAGHRATQTPTSKNRLIITCPTGEAEL